MADVVYLDHYSAFKYFLTGTYDRGESKQACKNTATRFTQQLTDLTKQIKLYTLNSKTPRQLSFKKALDRNKMSFAEFKHFFGNNIDGPHTIQSGDDSYTVNTKLYSVKKLSDSKRVVR
jgi:hypothetical protein